MEKDIACAALYPFYPLNRWLPDEKGPKWLNSEVTMYVIDAGDGQKYLNENNIRVKCAAAALLSPIFYPMVTVITIITALFRIISCYHFWKKGNYPLKDRALDLGKDLLRVPASAFVWLFLTLSGIWGIFFPHDGRKVFTSIELAFFGTCYMTCFQPNPKKHLFGGRLDDPNSW